MTSCNNDAYLDGNYETVGESTQDIYDDLTPSQCDAGYIQPIPRPSDQSYNYIEPIPGSDHDTTGDTSQDPAGDAMSAERQVTCKNLPWWAWTNNDAYLDGNYETVGESAQDIYDDLTPSQCDAGYFQPIARPSDQSHNYNVPIPGSDHDTAGGTSQDPAGDAMSAERQITCKNLPWWAWTNIVLGVLLAACIIALIMSLVPSMSNDACIPYPKLSPYNVCLLLSSCFMSAYQIMSVHQITYYCN